MTRLLDGPYEPPEVSLGDYVQCERRGKTVDVTGWTDAHISWPYTGRKDSLILCGDLIRAVQTESVEAISHYWGASVTQVWMMRVALGINRTMTEGTKERFRELMPKRLPPDAQDRGRKAALLPESRAKNSAWHAGKSASEKTREALLSAAKRSKSEAHKVAMSEAHKQRGSRPVNASRPEWTAAEDATLSDLLARDYTDRQIAHELSRSIAGVRGRRKALGIRRSP